MALQFLLSCFVRPGVYSLIVFSVGLLLLLAFGLFFYLFIQSRMNRHLKLDLPVLNLVGDNYGQASREWQRNYIKYIEKGYQEFRHGAYQLWGPEGFVTVLSPDFLGELKNLPDEKLSFYLGAANSVQGKHQFLDFRGHAPIQALKSMMTPKLKDFMPAILEELEHGTRTCLPSELDEWHEIHINDTYSKIVGYITGRLFFGSELGRREDWLQHIIAFPDNVFRAARKIRRTPAPLRLFRIPLLREVQQVILTLMKARQLIPPILEKRALLLGEPQDKLESQQDFMQFVLECSGREENPPSLNRQAEQLMIIMLAGIHTTNIAGIHMIYDLAAMPEIVGPLRDEINQVWDKYNGKLTKDSFRDMGKLDSFMKESQRMNPPSYSTFDRIVSSESGITLSNGLHLPKGTVITMPSSQVSQDPNVWSNPEEYDAFRFERLRSTSSNKYNYLYATSTETSLHFGVGRHACPGRWVSTIENKTILSYMIRHFDFRLVNPKEGRPKNLAFGPNISPNETGRIEVKRIRPHMK
ncbi:cytochrome p450 monooxygenase [Colletotrichum truncatum]|uniref:Cytochrome p450 monooxygenase n=1 Tax=Colletotrichum truncatum TaxID=5467 RepID=A0ACC3YXG9_COLTU|nr:cytochrome p450 monooxygenase [Colletotrichum truncatum]XP_036582399.1 cytochrome p450 monooxygenase [Colletotrichum truncatum]KAF6780738.1 cytochrome p450 monooxygenase [Colletotrichum truncatum]KAF6791103.1 cytochrome p450 monooxygenase [Colletotrichum truncatum]